MAAQRTTHRHGLEVSFGTVKQYTFLAASPRYSWTEVTVVDESTPSVTLDGVPLVSNYEGAHCIYRGYMEQFECKGGKRLVALREVALKWVVGAERVAGAKREAGLYDKELRPLQGSIVPRFYGCFTSIIGDVEVACIVLEWCAGPPIKDTFELNRQRMIAGLALHKAGVMHNKVLDPMHYIALSDGTLRMVGFSSAKTHQCAGTTILSRDVNGDQKPSKGCSELAALESRFGVDSDQLGTEVRLANKIFPAFDAGFFYRY
ncbi:hypothetical protein L226DRAFT_607268 [Lentinus tigrinus ALCF2SS1-7]|uniref:uncharacterized protein n=1 Tax=Lentinus tigrinus ALCF2SS1-7 TaxID=1328758 RepID=UPI001165E3AA|nr:hypothetical protein L226DRAFT_607268 [Lentinus tigrinus ALCF2SS1-7]